MRYCACAEGLTGFSEPDGRRSDASRAGASADENGHRVIVCFVRFRMFLVPSPIAQRALVNEGEGLRFVSHIAFDAETEECLRYGSTMSGPTRDQ